MKLNENSFTAEIRGNVFCLLEGIERIVGYTEERIETATAKGSVVVSGTSLKLIYYSEDRIGIRGNIDALSFGGGGC